MHSNYRAAAERLGLTMTPADPGFFATSIELAGELEKHPVRVRRVIGLHELDTEVYFQPAFDLGLDVAPAGQPGWASTVNLRRIGRLFSRADMHIGDAELDDAFAIHGDEDTRVRTLLEGARAALLDWYESEVAFELSDARVRVRRYSYTPGADSVDAILGDLAPALALAKHLESVRASIPPAAALAANVEAFRALAARHGLGLLTTPLLTWGTFRSCTFWARATRLGAGRYVLEALIALADRLAIGGGVHSTGAPADAPFDQAFMIQGADLAAHLAPEARQALLALRAAGHEIALDDAGLALRLPLGPQAYGLEQTLEQAELVLQSIAVSLRPRPAYR